jgi:hypothetical protein
MNKHTVFSIVVGIVMYALVIYLAFLQRDLTGQQLILMLVAPLVIGFFSGGIKRGIILGFLISFVMLLLEAAIIQTGAFSNPNAVMAVIIAMVLPFAAISAGLGALGGLVGRRMFRKSIQK